MTKKITKSIKTKIWLTTSKCYCKALKEAYPDILKDADPKRFKEYGYDREMREMLVKAGVEDRNENVHRLYMKHVLQLTTKQLEAIIEADKQGAIRRAPYTIDEIAYELLDRAVKESETKEKA